MFFHLSLNHISCYLIKCKSIINKKIPHSCSYKLHHTSSTAKFLSYILTQRPYISSFGAVYSNCNRLNIIFKVNIINPQRINLYTARFSLNLYPCSCKLIKLLSINLKCRIHWGNLIIFSLKAAANFQYLSFSDINLSCLKNSSRCILSISNCTKKHYSLIGLSPVCNHGTQPRSFTKTHRKHANCIRVKCTGMTYFFHMKNSTKFCNHIV